MMNKEMIKLEKEYEKSKKVKKKHVVIGIVFAAILISICICDEIQQRRFATLKKNYELMDRGKYEDALVGFNENLSVHSDLYWRLMKKMNGYDYSKEKVEHMVEICLDKIHEDYSKTKLNEE